MKIIILSILLLTACNKKDSKSELATLPTMPLDTSSPGTALDPTPAPTTPLPAPTIPGNPSRTYTEEFMQLINDHRMKLGIAPLIHMEDLGKIALKHSQNMANKTVAFGHDGFSSRCAQARTVMNGGNYCGENVAMGQKTVQAAFNAWMSSSGHRANIEKERYTHTGFGYAQSSSGTWYWTQIFLESN